MAASAGQQGRSRLAAFLDWLTRPSGKGKRRYDGYADYRPPEPRVIRPWQVDEAPQGGSSAWRSEAVPDSALDATHVSHVSHEAAGAVATAPGVPDPRRTQPGSVAPAGISNERSAPGPAVFGAAADSLGSGSATAAPRAAAPLDATHTTTAWSNPGQSAAPWSPDALWRPSPDQQPATSPVGPPSAAHPSATGVAPPPGPAQPPAHAAAPRTLPPMADTGSTAHPARRILAEWPILLVLGGVAFGMSLALGDNDSLLSGTFVIGVTLVLAAALRLFLPTRTAGSLAIRRKAIDVAMYTSLGSVMVALGLLVQGIFGGSGSL